MNYPYNSTTTEVLVSGPNDFIWLTASEKVLLAVNIQQSGVASETNIYCGDTIFAKNYAKDLAQKHIFKNCSENIRLSKTGQDEAFVTLVYHEGFLKDPQELISNDETSAEFFVEKSISYGDAILFWFLSIFTIYLIFRSVFNFFWKND